MSDTVICEHERTSNYVNPSAYDPVWLIAAHCHDCGANFTEFVGDVPELKRRREEYQAQGNSEAKRRDGLLSEGRVEDAFASPSK